MAGSSSSSSSSSTYSISTHGTEEEVVKIYLNMQLVAARYLAAQIKRRSLKKRKRKRNLYVHRNRQAAGAGLIQGVDDWNQHFQKGVDSKKLVVAEFTASWCGPCPFIAPILAEIAKKTPHLMVLEVDVDKLKAVADEFKVEAMPTFVLFKEGKEVDRVVGARKEELQAKLTQHCSLVD